MKRRDFVGSPLMFGFAPQRAATSAKRRVILYDDGTQLLMSGDGRMQRDYVVRWVKALAGTHVDTIAWSVALPDICFYDTRAGERFGKDKAQYEPWEGLISRDLESLIRGGNDPLRVICETAHSIGMGVMAAVRMNDEHQSGGPSGRVPRVAFRMAHRQIRSAGLRDSRGSRAPLGGHP